MLDSNSGILALALALVRSTDRREVLDKAMEALAEVFPGIFWTILSQEATQPQAELWVQPGLGRDEVAPWLSRMLPLEIDLPSGLPENSACPLGRAIWYRCEAGQNEVIALAGWVLPGCCAVGQVFLRSAVQLIRSSLIGVQQIETLKRQSTVDSLTELSNRRGIYELLNREISRAERYREPISIIFIDLNRFKKINDRHGHRVGDRVLKMVASVLKDAVRESDVVGRLGGDEFLVILPQKKLLEAERAAQRLANSVGKISMNVGNEHIQPDISVGVAERWSGDSIDTWIERADARMYQNKKAAIIEEIVAPFGKSQVVIQRLMVGGTRRAALTAVA